MSRATGANAQILGKFETTYGTAPTGNYAKLPFVSTSLGSEQGLVKSDTLGNGRDPLQPSRDVIKADGDVVVPVDVRNFGLWLKALLGAPTTTGTGPYVHSFVSGSADLPSLALEIGNPEVPSYRMNKGVKVDKLSLKMATSGNLSATFSLIAQNEVGGTTSGGGTPTTHEFQRFSQFQGSVKKDGVALGNVVSADLTYQNGLEGVRVIRDDGLVAGVDSGVASLSGSLVVRFSDTTLLTAATSDTPLELTFGYAIDANTYLTFTAHEVKLPKPKLPINGPGGIQATFAWQAGAQSDGGVMLTAVLANDVASY